MRSHSPLPWTDLPALPDVRLVVADMDGTLLDAQGDIPAGFAEVAEVMAERGIVFAPASGRQLATLRAMFPTQAQAFIAENGAIVAHGDTVVSTTPLEPDVWRAMVRRARVLPGDPAPGTVLCGVESAYVEDSRPAFLAETEIYYHRLEIVPDLCAVSDDVVKVAIYDFGDAEQTAAACGDPGPGNIVIVSGAHWIDMMSTRAAKGRATAALARELECRPDQIVAFGDYLNDLTLMDVTPYSCAVANAHPQVAKAASYLAPSHIDAGVITVLRRVLDLD